MIVFGNEYWWFVGFVISSFISVVLLNMIPMVSFIMFTTTMIMFDVLKMDSKLKKKIKSQRGKQK